MTEQKKIEINTLIAKNQVAQVIEDLGLKDKIVVNPQNLGHFSIAVAIFYLANVIKEIEK